MSKSSRFWWLHGVILLSAAAGCKSNSCCHDSYGPTQSAPPPVATPPVYSSGVGNGSSMYSKYGSPNATYPGMTGGQTYMPPATSTTTYPSPLNGGH